MLSTISARSFQKLSLGVKQIARYSSQTSPSSLREKAPYFQVNAPLSDELVFRDPTKEPSWPVFRSIDEAGIPLKKTWKMPVSEEVAIKMYETLVLTHLFDEKYYILHRQGKTSFYMENRGEEASQVGSGAAWEPEDVLFFQYRELGTFLWRGYTIQQAGDTNFANDRGHGKGKQMPVHYGSKELNLVTISSPLSTQMPQAAGAGYALKRSKKKAVAVCYFGEGAASEGDAHAAFNFSATTESPVIWFCRNNAFAISTPTVDQYRGDGIVSRAYGYGMLSCRVDGNDIFAVYEASKAARKVAIEQNRPIMIEAMTYRGSHHSTSDDASKYREKAQQEWWADIGNPIKRMYHFLQRNGLWDENKEKELVARLKAELDATAKSGEKCPKPHWKHLFENVYDELPPRLLKQREELEKHLEKFGNEPYYKLHEHAKNM